VLDRDGVINHDSAAFIRSADQWRAIDGSPEAIALLTHNGFTVAVATNQSGLARGHFDEDTLNEIHRTMAVAVAGAGGKIDRIVFCPHGPDDKCACRKPAPGLLQQLGVHYGLSMKGVPFIGDSSRDLEAAAAIGARGILVRSGKGRATEGVLRAAGKTAETYDNLLQAAQHLIAERQ
jgi:D-glycero-D-manno-heptose 1,7-bisphosphate phosphatase